MNTRYLACLVIFLFGTTVSIGQFSWTKYESASGRFRAEFPGKPVISVSETKEQTGPRESHWARVLTNRYYFAIMFSDHPQIVKTPEESEATFDYFAKQFSAGLNVEFLTNSQVSNLGSVGREIKFEKLDETSVVRFFIDGSRVYTLIHVSRRVDYQKRETRDAVDRFFSSFEIVGKVPVK